MPRHFGSALDGTALKAGAHGIRPPPAKREKLLDSQRNPIVRNPDHLKRRSTKRRSPSFEASPSSSNDDEGTNESVQRPSDATRTRKRRKIAASPELPRRSLSSHSGDLPDPSSDFLKTIHYFAAHFYSGRGQLSNSTAEARRIRKERRLRKLEKKIRDKHGFEVLRELRSLAELEVERESLSSDEPEEDNPDPHQRITVQDMYRAFDGSALAMMGILLQEQIKHEMTSDLS